MAPSKPLVSQSLSAALASALVAVGVNSAEAAPPIRTNERNQVPACVTPERLMAFLAERNPNYDPRFREIARWYKYYGEGWRVRWDYAFYQMALETNFLSYRRGDGRRGDVWETQNNFAGIGATGGGVRGERFADVKTGVHAQIQHLVAYSGEHLAAPIAKRTRENQDDIIAQSNRLGRDVTFADLAARWATDRAYGKSIDFLAGLYSQRYCDRPARAADSESAPPAPLQMRREWRYPFRPPSGLGGPVPDDTQNKEEALPWLAKPQKPDAAAKRDRPAAVEPKASSSSNAPKKQVAKPSKKAKTALKPKKPASVAAPAEATDPNWTAATQSEQAGPQSAAANTAANKPAEPTEQAAAEPQTSRFLPWLPTFRIAPAEPEPSRLGGPLPAELGAAAKAAAEAPLHTGPCRVLTATYGGTKTLLLRSKSGAEVQYTALTIVDGFEKSMFEAYARTEAVGAEVVGEYPSAEAALSDARANCPENE
ncbi:glucosaminidase domain-containing protein [Hyphomicrobium sp.]|uniref:glucosaminidase domain-containing protein n=1 Tax=Hyphomicrobium sp. TaxID=82 RepID=UPI000FBB617F|nr:glucosaminidase domain-containing protein [Hyphomicrobium sp.]RUO97696.1 MAG: hypothetical protein EKK30_13125 [Hyphomicrobium sp.]